MADFGAILGGIGQAFSGFSSLSSMFDNSYDKIARQNREWQSEENQKNRDWQSSEWTRQFDATNEYNDPSNQVARLVNAHINPSLAFSNGSGQIGQSSASPSAPSGANGSVTTPFSDSVYNHKFQAAESFARSLEAISKIKPNRVSADVMKAQEDNLKALTEHEKVKTEMDEFDQRMQLVYGEALKNYEVNEAIARYRNILQDTLLKEAQGKEIDAHILEMEGHRLLMHTQRLLHGEERRLLKKQIGWYDKDIKSRIEERKANARRASAEASQVEFWNTLYNDEKDYLVKNIHNDAAQKFQNVKMSEDNRRLLSFAIEQARFATDKQEILFWNNLIKDDLKAVSDIASDWTKVGMFNKLNQTQKDRILQKEREFNSHRITEKHDGWTDSYNVSE